LGVKVGIDVGGTFTDFFYVADDGAPLIHKTLSTPHDPSIAVLNGLADIAGMVAPQKSVGEFVAGIDTIVHGTTVTTNATLTRRGAKSGLITNKGLRDALEMRRGIREEQYDNRYTNVEPLVERYLRVGVEGRLNRNGGELTPLNLDDVRAAIELFKREEVAAVSICFMNSFANPAHEQQAAELVRAELPGAYLTVSSELLPSIRFYERISTTALNSYIGPILDHYLDQLQNRLKEAGFAGLLMIMQSNGGVIAPETARKQAAVTLLSGPAAGPQAGLAYARVHDQNKCIVVDMGGTSFEASLVVERPITAVSGDIDRLRLALPMLDINTIGAGGGSIGWIDAGGLLRMGPQSAGAAPGPASYGLGGAEPATTDANVVLGYLNPDYFAGGSMSLDAGKAHEAVRTYIAEPMGLTVEAAAAGMFRVACTNMAEGVREVTIKRGHDPREFPMIVAGGAGAIHSCQICNELDIPLQIVPREASILCAAGMLMCDLKHDFVQTYVAKMADVDFADLKSVIAGMREKGAEMLAEERIGEDKRAFEVHFDCRYLKQYHEVSFPVPADALAAGDREKIAEAFHEEHNRLYGYSLKELGAPIEIVNIRVTALGDTDKPGIDRRPYVGPDASGALKGMRRIYVPERDAFAEAPIYDGHKMDHGNRVSGPAMIEQETTAILITDDYECVCDAVGSFVLYRKGREDVVASGLGSVEAQD